MEYKFSYYNFIIVFPLALLGIIGGFLSGFFITVKMENPTYLISILPFILFNMFIVFYFFRNQISVFGTGFTVNSKKEIPWSEVTDVVSGDMITAKPTNVDRYSFSTAETIEVRYSVGIKKKSWKINAGFPIFKLVRDLILDSVEIEENDIEPSSKFDVLL